MSTPTHADLLAAVNKARPEHRGWCASISGGACSCPSWIHDEFCDFLRATAERHAPIPPSPYCPWCSHGQGLLSWPCAEVRQVIDRLQAWGAL